MGQSRSFRSVASRRILTLAIFAAAFLLPARPIAAQAPSQTIAVAIAPALDRLSSSSSPQAPVTPVTPTPQPPPRRRFGRPRYNDNQHNADGSPKWTFELGIGLAAPVGNTYHYLNTSYGFQVGAGRNFSKNFGVQAQFDYDRFGFNGRTLNNQLTLFNYGLAPGNMYYLSDVDASSHIWSFSFDPIYTFNTPGPLGVYAVGGAGFYHKVATFTPLGADAARYDDPFYHYTSNAPGFNGGFGITYKAARFPSEQLFAEARYVLLLNSQRDGLTAANINTTAGQAYYNSGATDYYPANSNRTTYTAYKLGVRF
jgi:hypothetical protein